MIKEDIIIITIVQLFSIIIGGLILKYHKNIFLFLKKIYTIFSSHLKKILEFLKKEFKIIDKERKYRSEGFININGPRYKPIYYKPPFYWNYKKLKNSYYISYLFISIPLLIFKKYIYLITITIIIILIFISILNKDKKQKENLKNQHYTKKGIPLTKKNNQFIYPKS